MSMKIFELAKELDLNALDMVERLKKEGFGVRNHMASLDDEQVEQVRQMYQAEQAEKKVATKKKTKKKTAKKAVTKKKVVKKVSAKAEKTQQEAAQTEQKDNAVETIEAKADSDSGASAKKTVIRRKSADEADETKEVASDSSAVKKKKGGLRVVSISKKEETKSEDDQAATSSSQSEEKEVFKEKVHTFTPIYIPDEKEQEELRARNKKAEEEDSTEEDDKKKSESKKRLGGLASMMSGKKAVMSKAQALQQTRADSELKSYAALSSLGRPIYTQMKRKRVYSGPSKETEITEVKDSKRVVNLKDGGTIATIAKQLSVKADDLIDKMLDLNLLARAEDYVGIKLASKIAALYDYRVENRAFDEAEALEKTELTEKEKQKLPLRNPIITIMGHVDHGKTTLLDHIRNAKVASGEAGGITQHIGAYSVVTESGKKLTFLDTPGHAAFASMRQRGADVTDIVILVVAADDGVMPQTRESIKFCQNANKPIIVAVNKMDKEQANPDRVKSELAELNITPEDWGGDVQFVPISALKGDGVDDLLEGVALQAEMMELRANPQGGAEGVVIESKIEKGRGAVATVLVQTGTLKKGDCVVVGETFGRARSLTDSAGKQLKSAGPSIPVQILGLKDAPSPGDTLNVAKNEREAKKVADNRQRERMAIEAAPQKKRVSLEGFFSDKAAGEQKMLNMIVRSDVQGSFEAIKQAVEGLGNQEVAVKIIDGGVGPISDSDVELADSAEAIIVGFNMRPVTSARKTAENKGIEIKTYSIIYELINDVTLALEGMLEPEYVEKYSGRAEVKETFSVPKVGVIAGSQVIDGNIKVGCNIRLLRDGQIMFDGKLSSLRRFKDDVKEVKSGYECGIGLQNYNDIKIGDLFEAYVMEERKRGLDDEPLNAKNTENSGSAGQESTTL